VKMFSMLVLLAAPIALTACSTFGHGQNASVDYVRKMHRLDRELAHSKQQLEDLKNRNMVLETKLANRVAQGQDSGEGFTESVSIAQEPAAVAPFREQPENVPAIAADTVKPVLNAKPVVTKPVETKSAGDRGEQMIYSKIIDTYRLRQTAELKKSVQILLKAYPDSVYADNALFLTGSLGFETNDYAYARMQLDRLIQTYPHSNKVVSALFALAVIGKREGKFTDARNKLISIKALFPGSPEAMRVNVELKLLGNAASVPNKKRET
jgi:TolA-binding protein